MGRWSMQSYIAVEHALTLNGPMGSEQSRQISPGTSIVFWARTAKLLPPPPDVNP